MLCDPAFTSQDGIDVCNVVVAVLCDGDDWEIICSAVWLHVLNAQLREAVLTGKEIRTEWFQEAKHAPWILANYFGRALDFSSSTQCGFMLKFNFLFLFLNLFRLSEVIFLVDCKHVYCSLFRGARDPLGDRVEIDALDSASIVASTKLLDHFAITSSKNSNYLTFKGGCSDERSLPVKC